MLNVDRSEFSQFSDMQHENVKAKMLTSNALSLKMSQGTGNVCVAFMFVW